MTFLLCFLCFVAGTLVGILLMACIAAGTLVGILLMACIAAGAAADRNDPFIH
jgi:hypothetical protein